MKHPKKSYAEVYGFIREYKQAHGGNSPSIREIADGTGYSSTHTVSYVLPRLEELGRIKRGECGKSRQIELLGEMGSE